MAKEANGSAVTWRIVVGAFGCLLLLGMGLTLTSQGASNTRQWEKIQENKDGCSANEIEIGKTSVKLDGHIESFKDFRTEQRVANQDILQAIRKQ